ncbi:2-hydroxyacyl-CoA dehydratase [bacterium]|nr:2-hydroxyacyl-CoA dehydratase [bacterium]
MPRPATPVRPTGKPLALVGGPLLFEHLALFEQIEAAGGRVVLEATAEGERGMPAPFDRRKLAEDPLGCLADAYFGAILDAFRRPNDALYSWLGRRLPESGAAGIAFVHYVWCDLWHAEAERLRQWTALPVLALDLAEDGLTGPVRTRLEAFVEMLP